MNAAAAAAAAAAGYEVTTTCFFRPIDIGTTAAMELCILVVRT